jgi:cytochrome c oxidase cbb3-type subunit 2
MMARHLYPKPRDFTRGIFRFKTTQSGSLPRDSDLFRTISVGVQGTAMPTWRYTLSESQRWSLVHYLKTFSDYFSEEPPGPPVELGAETPAVKVHTERGRELYVRAGCISCHGPDGYGDGQSADNMEDSFGFPIRPRNFHQAREFKRGRTRQNVALTIATGNDGTPMPSFLYSLKKDEIWTLADYVMAFEVDPVAPSPMGPMNGCRMMGGRFLGGPMRGGHMMMGGALPEPQSGVGNGEVTPATPRMPCCGMGRGRSTEDQYVEEEPTSAFRGCPMQAPNPNP